MQNDKLEQTIIEAITDKKGHRITVVDLSAIESSGSMTFIICEGNSTSQVGAIADNVMEQTRLSLGIKPYNYDGMRNCQWVVIDYGNVMVHIFVPDARSFYDLEGLWTDAPQRQIPDLD